MESKQGEVRWVEWNDFIELPKPKSQSTPPIQSTPIVSSSSSSHREASPLSLSQDSQSSQSGNTKSSPPLEEEQSTTDDGINPKEPLCSQKLVKRVKQNISPDYRNKLLVFGMIREHERDHDSQSVAIPLLCKHLCLAFYAVDDFEHFSIVLRLETTNNVVMRTEDKRGVSLSADKPLNFNGNDIFPKIVVHTANVINPSRMKKEENIRSIQWILELHPVNVLPDWNDINRERERLYGSYFVGLGKILEGINLRLEHHSIFGDENVKYNHHSDWTTWTYLLQMTLDLNQMTLRCQINSRDLRVPSGLLKYDENGYYHLKDDEKEEDWALFVHLRPGQKVVIKDCQITHK